MTSLEFIEKEIKELEFQINYIKSNREKYIDFRTEGQLEVDMKQLKLKYLQQIKSELEVLEICKNDPVIIYTLKTLAKGEIINWHRLPKEQQETLKKALEVEDECRN